MENLTKAQLSRVWNREDGVELRIDRCLIDANWASSTEVVYQFCRHSPFGGVLTPSHGRYVGAASLPFADYRRQPGDRVGHNWRIPAPVVNRPGRHVLFDTNYWKSFVHARLAVPLAQKGCLSLFGERPDAHRLFADQLSAEYRVRTEGRGRTVDEWRQRPSGGDNHWFDGIVGCAVAASMQGANLSELAPVPKKPKKKVSIVDLYNRAREREAAAEKSHGNEGANISELDSVPEKPKKHRSMLDLYNQAREREAAAGIKFNND